MLRKHLQYVRYLARHKWFVYREGRRLGVARWQLIVHDWHKMLPSEWIPYADYFYGTYPGREGGQHGRPNEEANRRDWEQRRQRRFDEAWLRHQHRAPHHWQHWILMADDDGERKLLEIPDRYRREMVADWRGAGRALGFPDTPAWYLEHRAHIQLAPETRAWVENELGIGRPQPRYPNPVQESRVG